MLFTSQIFLVFFTVVYILYWLVQPFGGKIQNIILLIASYIFFGWWDIRFLPLIISSTLIDFFISFLLEKENIETKRKLLLGISIVFNLGLLFIFKYLDFFIESFSSMMQAFGIPASISTLKIILPIGISFYTFQTLSYTIDVYRRKIKASKSIIEFGVFVAFFPQLVAGPIERASNLLPQFKKTRSFDYSISIDGAKQILWGFFKKVVVANNCAIIVDYVYTNQDTLNGSSLFIASILFSVQIYCDFSGYSDIAIGLAKLFNIRLNQNFNYPYFSANIADFWRKWHISLSSWFKDYLYIPLGGSKNGTFLTVRNLFLVFVISGLWHGANWTFIIWGLFHFILIVIHLLFKKNKSALQFLPTSLRIVCTFALVTFGWIFFRSESILEALAYINGLFQFNHFLPLLYPDKYTLTSTILLTIFLFCFEWFGRSKEYGLKICDHLFAPLKFSIYYFLIFLVFIFSRNQEPFIYFQF